MTSFEVFEIVVEYYRDCLASQSKLKLRRKQRNKIVMVTSGYENFLLEVQNHQEENYHSTSDDVAATPSKRNIYNKGNNLVFFAYRISPDLFNKSVNFSVFQANKVLRSSDT